METKNYGLNLKLQAEHEKPEDWVFGATSQPCVAQIPEAERKQYLPDGEVQRGKEDMMDCATRAPNNILEEKFNWLVAKNLLPTEHLKFLQGKGYVNDKGKVELSDAFVSINAGTTEEGNSLVAPLEAIRKKGLIPKSKMPFNPSMTFSEYINPARITSELRDLGLEFTDYFAINYEKLHSEQFAEVLDKDFVDTGGYAWPVPVNGEYKRVDAPPNHSFMLFSRPMAYVFDNYIDPVDGDFIKKLASDYKYIDIGYRVYISFKDPTKKLSYIGEILSLIKQVFVTFFTYQPPLPPLVTPDESLPPPALPVEPTPHVSRIEDWAKAIEAHETDNGKNPFLLGLNNPCGLRCSPGFKRQIACNSNYAVFATVKDGRDTACNILRNAASGLSLVYKPDMTLYEFFAKYAPSSDNADKDPKLATSKQYAERVALALKVVPEIKISQLL